MHPRDAAGSSQGDGHGTAEAPDPTGDPDDTDGRYLRLWKSAWVANGRHYIRDGRSLPRSGRLLTVYRGQMPEDKFGIAWTTDPKIAQVFANGAGARVPQNGTVFMAHVHRDHVYAYLTGRGESEVILDPFMLRPPTGAVQTR